MRKDRIHVTSKTGEHWYYRIEAANHAVLATSETYSSRSKAIEMATNLHDRHKGTDGDGNTVCCFDLVIDDAK